MRTIIGLCGYAGSGKDEAAKGLVELRGYTRIALADQLREALVTLNPIVTGPPEFQSRVGDIVDQMGWTEAKLHFPEIRELLQRLGTDVGRKKFGEDFWVEKTMARVEDLNPNLPVVITDVRFPNEVAAIHKRGGKVIRITRPGYGPVNNHISDTGISNLNVDSLINNTGSARELREFVCKHVDFLLANTYAPTPLFDNLEVVDASR